MRNQICLPLDAHRFLVVAGVTIDAASGNFAAVNKTFTFDVRTLSWSVNAHSLPFPFYWPAGAITANNKVCWRHVVHAVLC